MTAAGRPMGPGRHTTRGRDSHAGVRLPDGRVAAVAREGVIVTSAPVPRPPDRIHDERERQMASRSVLATAALAAATVLGLAMPAHAAVTNVSTVNNYAGARYDSSIDTFTVWDNGPRPYQPDDGYYARLVVKKVNTSLTFTRTHEWRSGINGQSRNFVLPDTFRSGDQISISICSVFKSTGSAEECRNGTAWV